MKKKQFLILIWLLITVVTTKFTSCNMATTLDELIEFAREKRWVIPLSFNYACASNGYNCSETKVPLADVIFCNEFTIQDVSLFSKLSAQGKVKRRDGFGSQKEHLFTTLLAPTKVSINAEYKEEVGSLGCIYRFPCSESWRVTGAVGFTIPIKNRLHSMDLSFTDGSLFSQKYSADQTVRENSVFQFYNDYINIYDFFTEAILAQKNLIFEPRQHKVGIGDISLFGLLDFGGAYKCLDGWQIGVNFVLPSGGKLKGNKVWEIVLGNGGAFQADIFTNVIFSTESPVFNPTARFVVELSAPYTGIRRIPHQIKNETSAEAQNVEGLIVISPEIFNTYAVSPFDEYDTSVLWFADHAVDTRIKTGTKIMVGFGNYFYNFLTLGFRLGIFYDFLYKQKDTLTVENKCSKLLGSCKFNTKLLEDLTKEKAHRIGWNLTYKFENFVELNIGSQHIFAGTNTPQLNECFISLIAVF